MLPFVNASNDPNSEYLSDGLTEGLINSLSQIPNLAVMSRSSVFHYKGKDIDPQQVARDLKIEGVVTGRIVQRGDQLIISAELIDARTNHNLWGEQYDRKLSDVLAVQDDITSAISSKLRERLAGEGGEAGGQRRHQRSRGLPALSARAASIGRSARPKPSTSRGIISIKLSKRIRTTPWRMRGSQIITT